ncbi:MAG: arylesterase, partial [Methylophilaceae bacterium]
TLLIKIIILCLLCIKASALEKIVLFGDSLMAGYGLPAEQHLSVVLQNQLQAKGYKIQVINGSVSGSTSAGGLNRMEWTLQEPGIDLVILGLGANDMLRGISPDATKANLEQMIQMTLSKKIPIILAGMLAPSSHGLAYKKQFDAIYPSLAKQYNLQLIPFLLEGVAMQPQYNQSDGIHPNAEGTKLVSDTIEKKILMLLR